MGSAKLRALDAHVSYVPCTLRVPMPRAESAFVTIYIYNIYIYIYIFEKVSLYDSKC